MGWTRDAAWKWLQCALAANGRGRRGGRRRDRHLHQPAYWQGLASLEPRLMMSVTANIIDPPLPYVIDEAGSITFTGEAGGGSTTPAWTGNDPVTEALTTNSLQERDVAVSGDHIAWSSGRTSFPAQNYQIWFKDGDAPAVNLWDGSGGSAFEPVIWDHYVAFTTVNSLYLWDMNDPSVAPASIATGVNITNLEFDAGNLVWQQSVSGPRTVVKAYTIGVGARGEISSPVYEASHPDVWGNQVAFRGTDGDVYLHTLGGATQNLSSLLMAGTDGNAGAPQLHDGKVVWRGDDGSDTEIYYFNGTTTQALSSNAITDDQPVISADGIAWIRNDSNINFPVTTRQVLFYDFATELETAIVSGSAADDVQSLGIEGRNLVWSQRVSGQYDIFFYNGDSLTPAITRVNDAHSNDDRLPVISESNIAWLALNDGAFGDEEIVFARYDGLSITWDIDGEVIAADTLNPTHVFADNGVYSVTLTVSDGASTVTDSLTVTVNNLPPTVQINGGPVGDVEEGDGVNFTFSGSDPAGAADPLSYSWTVLKNGNLYASGGGTNVSFTPNDNGTYELGATANDGDGGVTTAVQTINVINAAPVIGSFIVPALAVRSQDVTVSAAFSDAGSADTHTALWQVRDAANVLVASGSGATLQLALADLGSYSVTFTVTDNDGGMDTQSAVLNVVAAAIGADPLNPGQSLLSVGGGAGADSLRVRERDGVFDVFSGGDLQGSFLLAASDRIQVFGGDGNDWIRLDTPAGINAEVYGGDGDDWIRTGDGDDIIVGGAGDDLIFGNGGRDLLIGGAGRDNVLGNDEDDILIGGEYLQWNERAALLAISAAWTSSLNYLDRIGMITTGVGLDSAYRLDGSTLLDDGVGDLLLGQRGLDWFIGHGDQDVTDDHGYELLTAAEYSFVTEI